MVMDDVGDLEESVGMVLMERDLQLTSSKSVIWVMGTFVQGNCIKLMNVIITKRSVYKKIQLTLTLERS